MIPSTNGRPCENVWKVAVSPADEQGCCHRCPPSREPSRSVLAAEKSPIDSAELKSVIWPGEDIPLVDKIQKSLLWVMGHYHQGPMPRLLSQS